MNNIKALRQSKNMTRKALSDKSGVPARTIDDWENGRRIPRDVYQIKKIADALDVKIEDLINFKSHS